MRHRTGLYLLTCFVVLLGFAFPSAAAQESQPDAPDKIINVELILDVSGSMAQVIETGETRMDAAKRVLNEVVSAIPERENINVGLRIYGHLGDNTDAGQAESCQSSELVAPVSGVNKQVLLDQIMGLQPTGWTPLALSLERAGQDFQPGENVTNAAVLVTDGLETCGGDPCGVASALHAAEIELITHVVGFALTPEEQATLGCIAEGGGGLLLGAANSTELTAALFEILEELEVVQGTGFIGGNAFPLLPEGNPGELSVLAIGPYDGTQLPIVIRNNTGQDVIRITATVTARNPAGQVIGSGGDQLFSPNLVRSGGLAFGYAYFAGVQFPADTQFDVQLDATPATDDQFENRRDLEVVEASTIDGRVVGTLQNTYGTTLTGPFDARAVCFDEAGALVSLQMSFLPPPQLGPDETVTFQTDNFTGTPCPLFLVAASGWDNSFGPNNSVEPPGPPTATTTTVGSTTSPSSPTAVDATTAPNACVDLASAEEVLLGLQAKGIPIGEYIVYTAETDPNQILGRPGQYIGKANFRDATLQPVLAQIDVSEGGTVEVFATVEEAEARRAYVEETLSVLPLPPEYIYLEGTVLLRLSHRILPDQALLYEAALQEIVNCSAGGS
jgi:hypothetical protein